MTVMGLTLYMSQVACHAGSYPGFGNMKRPVSSISSPSWMGCRESIEGCSIKLAGTNLYTWVGRGTVRVWFLSQEHNTMSLARARTRTAQTETSAIIMYETTSSQLGDIGKLIDVKILESRRFEHYLLSEQRRGSWIISPLFVQKRPQSETLANKDLTFKFLL